MPFNDLFGILNLPCMSQTLIKIERNRPQQLKESAESLQQSASRAALDGNREVAVQRLIDALRLLPNLMTTYRQLGRTLATEGSKDEAELCFRGELPGEVLKTYFPSTFSSVMESALPALPLNNVRTEALSRLTANNDVLLDHKIQRSYIATPVKRSISPPDGLTIKMDSMFSAKRLTSSTALVDRIENGHIWFDGFNRVVLNKERKIVDPHTRGNPAVIHDICKTLEPVHVSGRCFLIGNRGYNNFYHWMVDIFPSFDLFKKSGINLERSDRFLLQNGSSSFQRACLEHIGIEKDQIIEVRAHSPFISADELIVPFFSNAMAMTMGNWVPRFLKQTFLSDGCQSPLEAKKLYIARAKDARNGRAISNEEDVIRHLEARGFVTVWPENYSVQQQAALFRQADFVLASHGAGLTNIVFCEPGTTIIELYGDYMATCYWAISRICGFSYLNHCFSNEDDIEDSAGRSREKVEELRNRGFSVCTEQLADLLDLADDIHAK